MTENKTEIKTEFGTANIADRYYRICTSKEGNQRKLLHRLLFCKYNDCTLEDIKGVHIHHIDGDAFNNSKENLMAISPSDHSILHHKGVKLTEEHKKNISKSLKEYGKSEEHMLNISKAQNTTGYYRVSKYKANTCKQGFTWGYHWRENGKTLKLSSVDLDKLKEKVIARGLPWIELNKERR